METKVAYTVSPLEALQSVFRAAVAKTESADELIARKSREWGDRAYIEMQHIGGHGPCPIITDHNGHGCQLRAFHIPNVGVRYKEVE